MIPVLMSYEEIGPFQVRPAHGLIANHQIGKVWFQGGKAFDTAVIGETVRVKSPAHGTLTLRITAMEDIHDSRQWMVEGEILPEVPGPLPAAPAGAPKASPDPYAKSPPNLCKACGHMGSRATDSAPTYHARRIGWLRWAVVEIGSDGLHRLCQDLVFWRRKAADAAALEAWRVSLEGRDYANGMAGVADRISPRPALQP